MADVMLPHVPRALLAVLLLSLSLATLPTAEPASARLAGAGTSFTPAAPVAWSLVAPAAEPFPEPQPWGPPAPGQSWTLLASTAQPLLCVLDSGADPQHGDLAGRIVAWHDFVRGAAKPYDDNGHGTHVAGIAAGSGAGDARHRGVAPQARLAVGKVMDATGHGNVGMALEGLRWCAAQGAIVVNLSLEADDCAPDATLSDAIGSAVRSGMLVVVAAGNHGTAPCALHAPATIQEALTVGALAGPRGDEDTIAGFSGRGAAGQGKPDVVAPGQRIVSLAAGTKAAYRSMDGTSMAAPYVSGVAAVLRAAHPEASVQHIADALRQTARDGGPVGFDGAWGWGAVQPAQALAWLDAKAST